MALFKKCLTSYFPRDSLPHASVPVNEAPATVFLDEIVDVCDSINHCARSFSRKKNGELTKGSNSAIQRLTTSAFALMMSHFETYQKAQFAELINTLDFMNAIEDAELAKRLDKCGCQLSLARILTGRGNPREPGEIVADALPGWHHPERVNTYFKVVFPQHNFYSNEEIAELELMWQLRHSIVHTGGVITREDARKVASLSTYSDRGIVFSESFMPAVGRRFHIILQRVLDRLKPEIIKAWSSDYAEIDAKLGYDPLVDAIVAYKSPRNSWFKE